MIFVVSCCMYRLRAEASELALFAHMSLSKKNFQLNFFICIGKKFSFLLESFLFLLESFLFLLENFLFLLEIFFYFYSKKFLFHWKNFFIGKRHIDDVLCFVVVERTTRYAFGCVVCVGHLR